MSNVTAGVLRGCGRQSLGAAVNVAFFWFLGLPLAWVLGFQAGFGIEGMWWGLSIATTLQVRASIAAPYETPNASPRCRV